ncbi:MAG: type IX secretion system membrane protein PorP/SprF [Prolixibacteraceae bacterium]|nr:type IX secretion system membrane protein PorP/SprF [Prolixibacteraceae bacterium]
MGTVDGKTTFSRLARHYYGMLGVAMPLNDKIIFRPSMLAKFVRNAPVQMDFNASFLFSFVGNAQLKKANKLYNYFNYSEAIPYYLKVVESNNSQEQKEATQRLADCYRPTNNVVEARKWYQKVLQTDGADPINYFYLRQTTRRSRQKYLRMDKF